MVEEVSAEQEGHQCCCLLGKKDRCGEWVNSPDQSLCDNCESSGHQAEEVFTLVLPPGVQT